jgi:hypothetical protein
MKKWVAIGIVAIAAVIAYAVNGFGGIDEKVIPAEARVIEFDERTDADYKAFHRFVTSIETGTPDWIRVITHTAEGEPTIGDVKYDGKRVQFTIDTTQGMLNGKKIETYTCKPDLQKTIDGRTTVYNFNDCNNKSGVLTLFYEPTDSK